jgi:hypothetical protein
MENTATMPSLVVQAPPKKTVPKQARQESQETL